MKATVSITKTVSHTASDMLLGSNIEAYENNIPWMLSDRLRNPKFAGPADPQTGIAQEWQPGAGRTMGSMVAQLILGMSLSGNESQMLCNYSDNNDAGISQTQLVVRKGEIFELEIWARTKDTPSTLTVSLHAEYGVHIPHFDKTTIVVNTAYWSRYTATFGPISQDDNNTRLTITVGGGSYVCIDQVHLRPIDEGTVSQALLDRFDSLVVPNLRFPGGCISCNYRWQHSVGPVHLRPVLDDPVFKHKTHYDFGTDEYLELCRDKNIRPFITLNVSTATPEECAQWATYCREWWEKQGLEAPLTYFMFGNENYGTWEIGHMTGKMYADLLPVFVPGVRDAYPNSKIMAIGQDVSWGQRKDEGSEWLSTVIEKSRDYFDILAVTRYKSCGDKNTLDQQMQAVADGVVHNYDSLSPIFKAIEQHQLSSTVAVVEWNYWTSANHADDKNFREPNDIRHCLFVGGMLNLFAQYGNLIEVANHYTLLVTMGIVHIKDGIVEDSDVVKVFDLYAPAFPGEVLESSLLSPTYGSSSKAIGSISIRAHDTVYTFIINYHSSESVDIDLHGFENIEADSVMLSSTDIHTPVTMQSLTLSTNTFTMPPMSLIRITSKES